MNSPNQTRYIAKAELLQALAESDGDMKNPLVIKAIENLVRLNPIDSPTQNQSLLQGNWLLINKINNTNMFIL